jgi:hypothetical protein
LNKERPFEGDVRKGEMLQERRDVTGKERCYRKGEMLQERRDVTGKERCYRNRES